DQVVPPSQKSPRKDLPPECDEIIVRALAKEPDERFKDADEMRDALMGYLARVGEGFDSSTQLKTSMTPTPRTSVMSPSGRRQVIQVATRGDVDKYESALRWRYRIGVLVATILIVVGLGAGGWAWLHRPPDVLTAETEPNDEVSQADPLTPGVQVT